MNNIFSHKKLKFDNIIQLLFFIVQSNKNEL